MLSFYSSFLKFEKPKVGEKMGKDLVPRFKCPLCGWLAYSSMLERGPYNLEIMGMRYHGFQDISYHKVRDGKSEYEEFLRKKVRELARMLGLKLTDKEVESAETEKILVEEPLKGNPFKWLITHLWGGVWR